MMEQDWPAIQFNVLYASSGDLVILDVVPPVVFCCWREKRYLSTFGKERGQYNFLKFHDKTWQFRLFHDKKKKLPNKNQPFKELPDVSWRFLTMMIYLLRKITSILLFTTNRRAGSWTIGFFQLRKIQKNGKIALLLLTCRQNDERKLVW